MLLEVAEEREVFSEAGAGAEWFWEGEGTGQEVKVRLAAVGVLAGEAVQGAATTRGRAPYEYEYGANNETRRTASVGWGKGGGHRRGLPMAMVWRGQSSIWRATPETCFVEGSYG